MKNLELKKFPNDSELAHSAALDWLALVNKANTQNKQHLVALSGGRITKQFFSEIVDQARHQSTSFQNVHFFWADERCVPPTHPDSNFAIADELLFRPLKIPPTNIHRLRGELDPITALSEANAEISKIAPKNASNHPVLDLIFLGMGEDGHIASLFPGAPKEVEDCKAPYLHINNALKPPPKRLTLSYAAIAAAKQVWVLASGKGKEQALKESLSDNGQTPLAKLLKKRSTSRILTDIVF